MVFVALGSVSILIQKLPLSIMKTSSFKTHVLVDSREQSISCVKIFLEEETFWALGNVEHIRGITFADRFRVLCEKSSLEDNIIISVHWLPEEQLEKAKTTLSESYLDPSQVILISYDCFTHIKSWCARVGCQFRPNSLKRRSLICRTVKNNTLRYGKSVKISDQYDKNELTRIWVQYQLMLAIISRSQVLGGVVRRLILNQSADNEIIENEYSRAIRYFELGEPDMAGGSYSCEKQAQLNPIDILRDRINKIAATDFNVLIQGDSGSGKEAVAWAIHEFSRRRNKPFIIINCAGMPDELLESEMFGYMKGSHNQAVEDTIGLLENAEGGTLFLDELPEMSSRIQAKLLRFLENGEYRPVGGVENRYADVRIVAAAQKERLAVASGVRPDLKSRINQLDVEISPLCQVEQESPGTIAKIAVILLERYTWTSIYHNDQSRELSPYDIKELQSELSRVENMNLLSNCEWKESNIRELNNFIRRWLVFGRDEIKRLGTKSSGEMKNGLVNFFSGLHDDLLKVYLQEPQNRAELKALSRKKPLRDLKKAYMRHLFAVYSQFVEIENKSRDLPQKATQKELALLMNITENTLSRLLN